MHNPESVFENETHNILWDFDIQTDHLISARRPDKVIVNKRKKEKKKENLQNSGLVSRLTTQWNWKKAKRRISTWTLLGNWKKNKLYNMKVTVKPIVMAAFDTVIEGLVQGLEDLEIKRRLETIQTIALFRSVRILWRILEIWGDFLSFKLQWETIS